MMMSESKVSPAQREERARLLLRAQAKRAETASRITSENVRLRFGASERKLSRRGFLKMVLPRYEVVPSLNRSKCAAEKGCHVCDDVCPMGAIDHQEREVCLKTDRCCSCGACKASCPLDAISYPTFNTEDMRAEIQELFSSDVECLEPKIVAFVCSTCSGGSEGVTESELSLPSNVLPVTIPCLALVSPALLLATLEVGAQGVVLVSADLDGCPRFSSLPWQENLQFVKALLDAWGLESKRLADFSGCGNLEEIEAKLEDYSDEVSALSRISLLSGSMGGTSLTGMIVRVGTQLVSGDALISVGNVPFGRVTLDPSQCSGCGVCARYCLTNALGFSADEDEGSHRITFQHSQCVGCGLCVEQCPERCLSLERVLALDQLEDSPLQLLEEKKVLCGECGTDLGTASMVRKLRGETSSVEPALCAECEIRAEVLTVRV